MSAPALGMTSVKKIQLQPELQAHLQQQTIEILAYTLWQQRGCPEGSPEEDWLEAKLLLQSEELPAVLGVDPFRINSAPDR